MTKRCRYGLSLPLREIFVIPNLKDVHGVMRYGVPAFVKRVATEQEWRSYVNEMRGETYQGEPNGNYFYELSVD